ncbi:MAG TPA: DUF2161 domain-containing phosphodiesterase, partial [Armatimonadota bacterium]
ELKRGFSTSLLVQAAERQRLCDSVYVALPEPEDWTSSKRWKGIQHLLRRLELGLLFVCFRADPPLVRTVFHPTPYERRRSARHRRAVIREVEGRSGEYHPGGCTRRKLSTAYRENAVLIACFLEERGPMAPKDLRKLGTGPKTLSILSSNFYGWFERVERGVYALKPWVPGALAEFPHLVSHCRARVREARLEAPVPSPEAPPRA